MNGQGRWRKVLVGSLLALSFLVASPADALAHGSGWPHHEIDMVPLDICGDGWCSVGQSLPTNVYAWNRTNAIDNERIDTTVRLWVWTNNGWQRHDQGWAYTGADDNSGSGGLWVYPGSSSSDQTTTAMASPVYVRVGYYYRTEVFIRWTSTGYVHSHMSQLYRAGY